MSTRRRTTTTTPKLVAGMSYEISRRGEDLGIATFTGKYGGMLSAPIFKFGDEEMGFHPARGYKFRKYVKGGRRPNTRKNHAVRHRKQTRKNNL